MKTAKGFIDCMAAGKGGLQSYRYYVLGIIKRQLESKQRIKDAINLDLPLWRRDKITNEVEYFDYDDLRFKKCQ